MTLPIRGATRDTTGVFLLDTGAGYLALDESFARALGMRSRSIGDPTMRLLTEPLPRAADGAVLARSHRTRAHARPRRCESALNNVDASLRAEIEREMMALRTAIANNSSAETVAAHATKITVLLDRAVDRLAGSRLSPNAAFVSSLVILLREGLESILVNSTIVAFGVRTGRRDALPYIHLGWSGPMALGAVTWTLARYMLSISGANRELTEGLTALLAAAMLLYVGWWLHSRSNAQAWNRYVREQLTSVILSTHIVQDVQELCNNMAIINKGQLLFAASPSDALRAAEGHIWEKRISKSELEQHLAAHRVISNKLIAGSPVIHVFNSTRPADDFVPVEPNLEVVFFSHINGTLNTTAA